MSEPTFECTVVSGPIEPGTTSDFELAFARRALALLKERLEDDAITALLAKDVEESKGYWAVKIKAANGEHKVAQTELSLRGLSAEQFLRWFHSIVPEEPRMLQAHPEHYLVRPTADGKGQKVLETLGTHVSFFTIPLLTGQPSGFVTNRDTSFPVFMSGKGVMPDGTPGGEVLHQFRNHADGSGFDARLSIWFPASCEDDLFEIHRQHLAVEFSNWILAAFESYYGR